MVPPRVIVRLPNSEIARKRDFGPTLTTLVGQVAETEPEAAYAMHNL